MKFLCYILSLCLLSLSTTTCLDAVSLLPGQVEEQLSALEQVQDPCEHPESEEDCAASCQCCHFHSILLTTYSTPSITLPTIAGKAQLNSLFFSKKLFSIWHPPKV